jgi:hypothetical protein
MLLCFSVNNGGYLDVKTCLDVEKILGPVDFDGDQGAFDGF